jgi:hypothetical protein
MRFTCKRCERVNELVSSSWRYGTEPRWFYDLHPIVRVLLEQNGDVPLLLAAHLRAKSRRKYGDVPEFELVHDVNGPKAELDLVANVDGMVVAAEAKSNGDLGGFRNAQKPALAAKPLTADQVILASTMPQWVEKSSLNLRTALHQHDSPTGVSPRVRIVAGLGTASTSDQELLETDAGIELVPWRSE